MGIVRRAGAGVGAMLLAVWACLAASTSPPTPKIKTEAPPSQPEALIMPKDCPFYVLGELKGIKKHGETWLNDGSACEMCSCFQGQLRCYYHYCNAGLTEGFMTPPSEQPPLDDEDHDNLEEGSGQPPQVDDFYKILHNSKGTGLHEAERENKNNQREKEMHHPTSSTFCSPPCWKSCPTGFKVDEVRGCQKCKCRKCPSMRGCQQQCPGGLEQDHHGCRTCHCQSPKLSIFTSAHDDFTVDEVSGNGVYTTAQTNPPCNTTRITGCNDGQSVYPVGVKWRRGPCVSCGCVAPGYTECNVTQCVQAPCSQQHRDSTTMQDAAEPCCPPCTDMAAKVETNQDHRHDGQNSSRVFLDHIPITHSHNHVPTSDDLSLRGGTSVGASDGMTKSAVQTSPVEWSQLCLIIVPLVLVFLLVAALTFHYCRRYHRDKYYISDYRATETEKLRPVKTADDHLHVRHV